jgi:hypothetical protein
MKNNSISRREFLPTTLVTTLLLGCNEQQRKSLTGSETETREIPPADAPPSSPQPPPRPSPPPTGSASEFNPGSVTWLGENVSGWRETSTITNVSVSDSQICISHTKSGKWPVAIGAEGNPWIFAKINGRVYGATYEWLRSGQVCKGVTRSGSTSVGRHTKVEPLQSWVPARGETIGLMVSTHARSGVRTVNERSNIVVTRWP